MRPNVPPNPSRGLQKRWTSWIIITVLLVGVVALVAMGRINLTAVAEAVGRARPDLVLATAAAFALTQVAFAARWWYLIAPAERPAFRTLLKYALVGAMLNVVVPMRAGDVSRAVLLYRNHGINLGDAGGVIAAERIADALTLVAIGGPLMIVLVLPAGTIAGMEILFIFVVLAAIFAYAGSRPRTSAWITTKLTSFFPGSSERISEGVNGVLAAVGRIQQPGVFGGAFCGHILGWALVVAALALSVIALSLSAPPLEAALAVLVLTGVGGVVIQVPAGIGAWHMLAAAALSYWNVPVESAVAYAIVAHGVGIAVPILWGFLAAVQIRDVPDSLPELPSE